MTLPLRVVPCLLCFCVLYAMPAATHAQGTRLWNEATYNEWEKGMPNGVAIGSDGTLSPGFKTETVAQLNAADVWAVASDKAGNAFVATGSPAQVLKIAPDGKQTILFTSRDLSVQALAMGPDGALYAATLPAAKVYRIPISVAKPLDETTGTIVFDAASTVEKPKYIWAMQFDQSGRLYLGTGAPGAVYRVNAKDGAPAKPELFFASDEPHIRSMLFAPKGDLLAGTDGTGLVYRIDQSGKGVVLYEAAKREVTALALGSQGQLYVAAVGEKGRNTSLPPLPVAGAGAAPTSSITVTVVQPGSTQAVSSNTAIQDGSEVYVVPANAAEAPRRIIAAHEDVLYALRAVPGGVLAATGNRGRVYRIHDDGSFEDMAHADAAQVTGFADAPDGSLYLPAANSGKLLRMRLEPANDAAQANETAGTLLSDVFDATETSQWGRVEVTAASAPASYMLEARTGNIDNPARGWSPWQPATAGLPGGRFAQWRLTVKPGARVSSIGLNYLPANAAPEVDEILVATGTRVNAQAMQPSYPQPTVLNFASQGGAGVNIDSNNVAAPLSAYRDKGAVTVRWAAHDDNGDELRFAVYFRGEGDRDWRLLRKNLTDRYLSFDAALLPDGPYRLRVVATDAAAHPVANSLTGERVSDLFLVYTETPQVTGLAATRSGASLHVTATATDGKVPITHAEYSLDAGPWQYVEPVGRISDALTERYDFAVPLPESGRDGAHIVTLRVFDRYENQGSARVQVP